MTGAEYIKRLVRFRFLRLLRKRQGQLRGRNWVEALRALFKEEIDENIEQSWGVGEGEL